MDGDASHCRRVVAWDAERDLVAYELRRDDCAAPGPALSGRGAGRKRKSIFELQRISTGELVDVADCEISYSLSGGEASCDLDTLLAARDRQFRRLRPDQRGTREAPAVGAASVVHADAGALVIPTSGEAVRLGLASLGAAVVDVRHTQTHAFVQIRRRFTPAGAPAPDSIETLVRLPRPGPDTPVARRQRELLDQAAWWGRDRILDGGQALVAVARAGGPLPGAALAAAFCKRGNVQVRIDAWKSAARGLAAPDRTQAEAALAARGCFGATTLARYDEAAEAMATARRWLDGIRRGDRDVLRDASALPMVLRGLWEHGQADALRACGGKITGDDRHEQSYELDAADAADLERALACLVANNRVEDTLPALGPDGGWPPDRGNAFDGMVGTMLPIAPKGVPRELRRYARQAAAVLGDGALLLATTGDNNGVTMKILLVVGGKRVRAAFVDWSFQE